MAHVFDVVVTGKFVLIDEEYVAYGGHQAAYDLPLCDELRRRRIPFRLLAGAGLDVPPTYSDDIVPMFATRAGSTVRIRWLPRIVNRALGAIAGNALTLFALVRRATKHVNTGDVIMMCRPLSRTRIAYGVWLVYLAVLGRRITVVYVLHNEPEPLFALTGCYSSHTHPRLRS